ncbi:MULTISPECIES: helix-turn-helix transcriptional regulator [Dorea]|uniref:helix-turn-helix transcriptional regulator n=2 Tax=Lachnospiraceae TaxID=186803 RepID=UPI000E510C63|nr:XRE family transcriptional regulator [Dorea longicatena]
MNIGSKIIEIRKKRNMTQEDFAKIFHVTRQTVSNWENQKSYIWLIRLQERLYRTIMEMTS